MKFLWILLLCGAQCIFAQEITLKSSFDTLLGKELGWDYVDQEADLKQVDFYRTIYEKQKDKQFLPPTQQTKIPKVFHFIWLGPKNFPKSSVENVRSWLKYHPEWKFKFWTDRPRIPPVSNMEVCLIDTFPFQKLKSLFENTNNWGEKSDLLRYEILMQEGGVYVDHDMVCLKNYNSLVSYYDFFVGLSTSHPKIDGFTFSAINCHFAAKPQHPVIQHAMDETIRLTPISHKNFPTNREKQVMNSSYIAMTRALFKGLDQEGNADIVFPNCYFLALGDLPNFYAKHIYSGAWRDELFGETMSEQALTKRLNHIEKNFRKQVWMSLGLSLCLLLTGYGMYRWKKN